jgi:hypothetical protein
MPAAALSVASRKEGHLAAFQAVSAMMNAKIERPARMVALVGLTVMSRYRPRVAYPRDSRLCGVDAVEGGGASITAICP